MASDRIGDTIIAVDRCASRVVRGRVHDRPLRLSRRLLRGAQILLQRCVQAIAKQTLEAFRAATCLRVLKDAE